MSMRSAEGDWLEDRTDSMKELKLRLRNWGLIALAVALVVPSVHAADITDPLAAPKTRLPEGAYSVLRIDLDGPAEELKARLIISLRDGKPVSAYSEFLPIVNLDLGKLQVSGESIKGVIRGMTTTGQLNENIACYDLRQP